MRDAEDRLPFLEPGWDVCGDVLVWCTRCGGRVLEFGREGTGVEGEAEAVGDVCAWVVTVGKEDCDADFLYARELVLM